MIGFNNREKPKNRFKYGKMKKNTIAKDPSARPAGVSFEVENGLGRLAGSLGDG